MHICLELFTYPFRNSILAAPRHLPAPADAGRRARLAVFVFAVCLPGAALPAGADDLTRAVSGPSILSTTSVPDSSAKPVFRTTVPPRSVPMTTGAAIAPPIGYVDFCRRQPRDCLAHPSAGQQKISIQSERGRALQIVNLDVNRAIAPVEDIRQYGLTEHWAYPTRAGDCEDYALLKRKRLIDLGWPERDLLLTIGFAPGGEAHTVLVVTTAQGDYVLDNRTNEIRPWTESPYKWLMRQSPADPSKWVRISMASRK